MSAFERTLKWHLVSYRNRWRNEEVAEAVREKKIKYGKWTKENTNEAMMEYCVVLPIYKGKGDPMECGSYRGIKLLEHAMSTEFGSRLRLMTCSLDS